MWLAAKRCPLLPWKLHRGAGQAVVLVLATGAAHELRGSRCHLATEAASLHWGRCLSLGHWKRCRSRSVVSGYLSYWLVLRGCDMISSHLRFFSCRLPKAVLLWHYICVIKHMYPKTVSQNDTLWAMNSQAAQANMWKYDAEEPFLVMLDPGHWATCPQTVTLKPGKWVRAVAQTHGYRGSRCWWAVHEPCFKKEKLSSFALTPWRSPVKL